ncbi:hypothetical protein LCGC14_1398930 [marine sediment metagenome]|uniref:Uncharacterized protein n=1 Tax=marine sediment metagenome TaxID=412755 RepID=A0A0F9MZ93_9ZZZZ
MTEPTDFAGIIQRANDNAVAAELAVRGNTIEGFNAPWTDAEKKSKAELRVEGSALFRDPLLMNAQHREATQHYEMQPDEDGPTWSGHYIDYLKRLDKAMQEDE